MTSPFPKPSRTPSDSSCQERDGVSLPISFSVLLGKSKTFILWWSISCLKTAGPNNNRKQKQNLSSWFLPFIREFFRIPAGFTAWTYFPPYFSIGISACKCWNSKRPSVWCVRCAPCASPKSPSTWSLRYVARRTLRVGIVIQPLIGNPEKKWADKPPSLGSWISPSIWKSSEFRP